MAETSSAVISCEATSPAAISPAATSPAVTSPATISPAAASPAATPNHASLSSAVPDAAGRFGPYGGRFVPETLMAALIELEHAYEDAISDPAFIEELEGYLRDYSGRPTPLYHAKRLGARFGLKRLYLKREDLNHTGAHKINNALGQVLLALRMKKRRIIAETGAGQHGVAVATVAAAFGLQCRVYMGEEDIERQALNVFRMKLLGAEVTPVSSGSRTLKDATNEAIRDWVANVETTHYIIGSVVGPHPYPRIVRDFQAVIGRETREQVIQKEGRLPDYLLACVGGGSNAMGLFFPFINDENVVMIGVEAAGEGIETGRHAASLAAGTRGVLHGSLSYVLQDEEGQIKQAHSISAGLDYPGVGPEHAYLRETGRAQYVAVSDEEALQSFSLLAETEGIIPALESAHALAYLPELAKSVNGDDILVVNLSGRGDKDVETVAKKITMAARGAETAANETTTVAEGVATTAKETVTAAEGTANTAMEGCPNAGH